jgi:hypothetical protein
VGATRLRARPACAGHLSGEDEEAGGSSAYVPSDPEEDRQLLAALAFLRGQQIDAFLTTDSENETSPKLRNCASNPITPAIPERNGGRFHVRLRAPVICGDCASTGIFPA